MKRKLLLTTATFFALVVLVGPLAFQTHAVSAQSGGGYDLTWNTIDGGGGTSTGGAYTLNGGFWNDTIAGLKLLFLPLIRR